ncbi:MAG TPA: hypothetical protein VEL79_18250 [Vicinamibacterales bacterium]|nr:hypothetical protein [Vicinamibacterales bacterium]
MRRLVQAALLLPFAVQACMSSTLVLKVRPDGSGQAVITTRVFESGIRALDSLFPAPPTPPPPPKLEELLPRPSEGGLERGFGARVRLASTQLQKDTNGGVRTTVVEFDDVTSLHLTFPPVMATPAGTSFGNVTGVQAAPVITFAVKAHENGDRLLLVRMPDQRISPDPNEPITTFKTDSPEEQAFKRAIKGMTVGFFVELEQPLLRTNAPGVQGNRATILNLDLDRMINAMDEPTVRRLMLPASLQEMLWQVGDLPGAIIPVDREIFLEYEPAQRPQPAAPPRTAAQAPPDTEIYLAPLTRVNGQLRVGPAENITNNPGYDNQPFFTPDNRAILFTSIRGGTQTDIYRYDLASRTISPVTQTPESEYSPTVMPDGVRISVIRVEGDGAQRLWSVTPNGSNPDLAVLLPDIKPVGYHAWADDHTLALFILGQGEQPATLQLADTRTGKARIIASDIARSLQPIPAAGAAHHISFVQRERRGDSTVLSIEEFDPASGAISTLIPAVAGSKEADIAWTPDGVMLMATGSLLFSWTRGESGWKEVTSLERLGLENVTRLVVSPRGDYLALVASPHQTR